MRIRDVVIVFALIIAVALFTSTFPNPLDTQPPTGKATQASLSLCINQPPSLSVSSCNLSMLQNSYYFCNLTVDDYDDTGNFTFFAFNTTSNFTFNLTSDGVLFTQPTNDDVGNHSFDFIVQDPSGCANNGGAVSAEFEVINVNDAPVFVPPLGPFEFETGQLVRGIFLANFFFDPDGDTINYSVSNVPSNFLINTVQSPPELLLSGTSCGEGTFVVIATDEFGASTSSNPIEIEIPCLEDESTGGGGGGGGSSCESNWKCGDWGRCYPNSTQKKTCEDLSECEDDVLEIWRNCTYIPACQNGIQDPREEGIDCGGPCPICETCTDGIQNQGELGVDCGGPCPTCRNCFDGIINFGETGVDCGGPCPACATCFDGVQNQGELGVDCGGPCPACTVLQTPSPVDNRSNPLLSWIIGITLSLVTLILLYRFFHKQLHRALTKLILYFLPKVQKSILLTSEQRDSLLQELFFLEQRMLLSNSQKEGRARYQDELGVILRKLFVIILGPAYSLQEVETILKKKEFPKLVKHLLHKQYIQLQSLEQDAVMSDLQLQLQTEFVRQRIFGFSETDRSITHREVDTKTIKGSSVEQVQRLLYNVSLALQLANTRAAKKNYLQALTIYDGMTAPEQSLVFASLQVSFDDIKYVSSYLKY